MRISELAADHYYHLGVVFPDRRLAVKELKKLTPRMDGAGLDYSKSAFAPNDAVFENVLSDSPEKTIYRVTHKFLAVTHHFVRNLQFEAFCKLAETFIPIVTDTFRMPAWLNRECIVQKLAPCPDGEDSRTYLSKSLLRLEEENLAAFDRQPHGLGVRVFFPAEKEDPVEFDVKIESFLRDPSRLFFQVHARFLQSAPVKDPKVAVGSLRRTKEFLEKKVFAFLEGPP